MDLGEQPEVLTILTQDEEILIAWVNPILKVKHDPGGQYKYSDQTIYFPQDISSIAKKFPQCVEELYFLILRK